MILIVQLLRHQARKKKQFRAVEDSSFKLDCLCSLLGSHNRVKKLMKLVIFRSHGLLLIHTPTKPGTSTIYTLHDAHFKACVHKRKDCYKLLWIAHCLYSTLHALTGQLRPSFAKLHLVYKCQRFRVSSTVLNNSCRVRTGPGKAWNLFCHFPGQESLGKWVFLFAGPGNLWSQVIKICFKKNCVQCYFWVSSDEGCAALSIWNLHCLPSSTVSSRHAKHKIIAGSQPRPQGPPRCPTNDLSSGASHAEGPGDEVVQAHAIGVLKKSTWVLEKCSRKGVRTL